MTDIGLTGGGAGRHMVYAAGKTDHTIDEAAMVEHLVGLVEQKAALIEAETAAQKAAEAAKQAAE
jgi:(E)-4-hydroxy-3-methylbut-2-enyl-diphosphate synthase